MAASRLRVSDRRITQRCVEEWQAIGVARLQTPEGGGKAAWHVREDADPMLARVLFPEQMKSSLCELPEGKRAKLLQRREILAGWYKACAVAQAAGTPERVATARYVELLEHDKGICVGRSTILDWHKAFRMDGLAGLEDKRGARAPSGPSPFLEEVKRFYLNLTQIRKKRCWEMAKQKARENGWGIKQYRTACRYLDTLPAAVVAKHRMGEDAYVAHSEPSIERDYSTLRSNEQWVGDHHQFDVTVNDGGKIVRPWLTAWMDMRSRKVLGWCIYGHDPNQNSILSAFRGGCIEHGVPDSVYIDNGKDYDSYAFHGRTKQQRRRRRIDLDTEHTRGILNHLDCKAHFCWKYHGQSKPIERFFNTLEDQFGRAWPTYCGNSPENRPENHAARVERGACPKLADFIGSFGAWLASGYHASVHRGDAMDGRSPDETYAASWNGAAKRTAAEDMMKLLLMKQSRPVRVTKNGVQWNRLRYGQYESALFGWAGKDVYLRVDERDVSSVLVFSPADQFICVAPSNARIPANASEQVLRDAIRQKKQNRQLVKDYYTAGPRIHEDVPDLMIRGMAEENARREKDTPPPDSGPGSIQPIRTPLTDQMPALRAALDREHLRPASGQEGMGYLQLGRALAAANRREESEDAGRGLIYPGGPRQPAELANGSDRPELARTPERPGEEPAAGDAPELEDAFAILGRTLRQKREKQP